MSIYTSLASNTALAAIVAGKIFPDVALKAKAPYVIYSTISATPQIKMDGGATHEVVRYQIDCYSSTKAQAEQIAELCRDQIEQSGYQISTNPSSYDPENAIYRVSNDYELIAFRT